MSAWIPMAADLLWRNALAVIPLALVVGAVCRWAPCRPATRHTLWLCVFLSLLAGLVLPPVSFSTLAHQVGSPADDAIQSQAYASQRSTVPRHLPLAGGDSTEEALPRSPGPDLADEGTWCRNTGDAQPAGRIERHVPPAEQAGRPATLADRVTSHDIDEPWSLALDPGRQASRPEIAPGHLVIPDPGKSSPDIIAPTPPWTVARAEPFRPFHFDSPAGSVGPLSTNYHGADQHSADSSRAQVVVSPPTWLNPPAAAAEANPDPQQRPGVAPAQETAGAGAWLRLRAAAASIVSGHLTRWLNGLVVIRDAVGRLPTIPPIVWGTGILLVLAIRTYRIVRIRRHLRAGVPAPPHAARLVQDAAKLIGLRRTPELIMVEERVSPMIWSSRRPRLVFPRALWSELDDAGRRAVVFHELAHVRRRDHWVCWIESLVGAVYWWHPLVWWMRGRLRDEAENCCDAWVTWLLPRNRRAYAEALLQTKQFVSQPAPAVPSPGIGVITGRTKRFARRLTMVMTERATPGLSVTGIALALSVLVAGWVATPARSCEPDEKKRGQTELLVVKPKAPVPCKTSLTYKVDEHGVVVIPSADVAVASFAAPAAPAAVPALVAPPGPAVPGFIRVEGDRVVFTKPMVVPTVPEAGFVWSTLAESPPPAIRSSQKHDRHLEERLARLEDQLARLSRQLEKLAGPGGDPEHVDLRHSYETATLLHQLAGGHRQELATKAYEEAVRQLQHAEKSSQGGGRAGISAWASPLKSGPTIIRTYELPKGKLEALSKLMIRSDVPILVSPGENSIDVHATEEQHARFKAFVDLIHPPKTAQGRAAGAATYRLGHTDSDRQWAAERAFRRALQHEHDGEDLAAEKVEQVSRQAASFRALARATAARAEQFTGHFQARSFTDQMRAKMTELRSGMEALLQNAVQLEAAADRLADQAENLVDEADGLRDQADLMRENASETEHRREAARLREQAHRLDSQARAFEDRAREMEARSAVAERKAEELEERAEELEEHLEEIEQELENLEDLETQLEERLVDEVEDRLEEELEELEEFEEDLEDLEETAAEA